MNHAKEQKKSMTALYRGKPHRTRKSAFFFLIVIMLLSLASPAFAADSSSPVTAVKNLSDLIFAIIKAIGMIMLGLGMVQLGLAMKGHDPSQRATSFLTIVGGLVVYFAQDIISFIGG